ncbi:LuxR C-terminal-related transcriptional regulator [Microvirga subterranea]|uniref:LuxR family two component transcriptional regulator n=1 Tax=Microvirga subterranea TaxID=186651 RepID=A0A370HL36_9HYPH|nr:response regulator transcription factor [Microvirga subterranea]RDI59303.1 LuxR family two component transcriptional regulator [Microvirga subterranea]
MTREALPVQTILVCKNSMLREGLKHTLSGTRFTVQADLALDAPYTSEVMPALYIVDIHLHQSGTADFVRGLKERREGDRVVVLAEEFDQEGMMSIMQAGADGYCLSTVACEVLVKYLDLVMMGETVFPAAALLSNLATSDRSYRADRVAPAESVEALPTISVGAPIRTLSSREAEILHCLMQGAPNKIIARKLDVAEATVKVHIKAILRKIRVTNRTQAAMWAVAHLPSATTDDGLSSSRQAD